MSTAADKRPSPHADLGLDEYSPGAVLEAGASQGRSAWLAPLVLAALAAAVRLVQIDKVAEFDELYHVLAARNWLDEGTFRIAEGVYERASHFTILIAGFFSLFGESLVIARLPSVIAGTLLVVLVFLWTRAVAGATAAWLAALLLVFWPHGIVTDQLARFYALQGLAFWLGAIGIYALVMRPFSRPTWLLVAAGSIACLGLACSLQLVTLIGLVGIGLWLALVVFLPWSFALLPKSRLRWGGIVVVVVLAAVAGLLLLQTELGGRLLHLYRSGPLWSARHHNEFWFYHTNFVLHYPTLWSLFPFSVIVALAYHPKPALFCLCVFSIAFLLHSIAAQKHIRYIYYVMPFLFVLWGMALAELWTRLRDALLAVTERALGALGVVWARRAVGVGVLAAALLFVMLANAATVRTVATLVGVTLPPLEKPPEWAQVGALLKPRLEQASVVLTTSELETLYYLGRYDILVSGSRLSEIKAHSDIGPTVEDGTEFSRDRRTGRPVISTPESMALVMACYPNGLVLSSEERWRNPVVLNDAMADFLTAEMTPLDLPAEVRMRAYVWKRPDGAPWPEACEDLLSLTKAPLSR